MFSPNLLYDTGPQGIHLQNGADRTSLTDLERLNVAQSIIGLGTVPGTFSDPRKWSLY